MAPVILTRITTDEIYEKSRYVIINIKGMRQAVFSRLDTAGKIVIKHTKYSIACSMDRPLHIEYPDAIYNLCVPLGQR